MSKQDEQRLLVKIATLYYSENKKAVRDRLAAASVPVFCFTGAYPLSERGAGENYRGPADKHFCRSGKGD